jgi:F-type H+-transporting ATPase subunit delta
MKISDKQYAQALFLEMKNDSSRDSSFVFDKAIEILKKDNRLSRLERVLELFINLWKKDQSIIELEIVSARPLEEGLREKVEEELLKRSKAKELKVNEKKSRKVIAGFVAKYNDKIIDASISNKVKTLKNNLIN